MPNISHFDLSEVDAEIVNLRNRITVKETVEFTKAYPAHFGSAVTIGGERFIAKDALGDPECPMGKQAVIDKAVRLMTHAGMTRTKAERLSQACLSQDFGLYRELLR